MLNTMKFISHACRHSYMQHECAAPALSLVLATWVELGCRPPCNATVICKLRGMSVIMLECPGEHLFLLVVLAEVLNFARKHTIADLLYTMSCLDLWPVSSAHCQAPTSSRPASIWPPGQYQNVQKAIPSDSHHCFYS